MKHKFKGSLVALLVILLAACAQNAGDFPTSTPLPTKTVMPVTPSSTLEPSPEPTATPTPLPPRLWSFDYTVHSSREAPALSAPVDEDNWEGDYTWAPFVVYHEGIFHMFYNGFGATPRGIGYATSEDGINFTRYEGNPVLKSSEIANANMIIGPTLFVDDDGTWVMYLIDAPRSSTLAGESISRYTSPEPNGPWTLDGEPVFTAEEGSWASDIVLRSVLQLEDGGILLAFDARYEKGRVGIGLLHSEDGYHFDLLSDAPVLGPGPVESWNQNGSAAPMLFATEDGYALFFLGFKQDTSSYFRSFQGNNLWLGYATSPDGLTWEIDPYNPVIQIPDSNGFAYMSGMQLGETYYLYYVYRAGALGVGALTVNVSLVE